MSPEERMARLEAQVASIDVRLEAYHSMVQLLTNVQIGQATMGQTLERLDRGQRDIGQNVREMHDMFEATSRHYSERFAALREEVATKAAAVELSSLREELHGLVNRGKGALAMAGLACGVVGAAAAKALGGLL